MDDYISLALNPPEDGDNIVSHESFTIDEEYDVTEGIESLEDEAEIAIEKEEEEKTNFYKFTKRDIQLAGAMVVSLMMLITLALIPMMVKKNRRGRIVKCADGPTMTLSRWLNQRNADSASLCDPLFDPPKDTADMSKPVKVFVMMGEANMLGAGEVHGKVPGTLEYAVRNKGRFSHLLGTQPRTWSSRSDVRFVAVNKEFEVHRNESLQVIKGQRFIGPEVQFGYVMGELLDEPVLLIKSCQAQQSLGGDLLPPGSFGYEYDYSLYAGYGESPPKWTVNSEPEKTSWKAGHQYDTDVSNVKKVLADIGNYYPGAKDYNIEGFVWWQGESDRNEPAYAHRYEENMVKLIKALRKDLEAPKAKFAIATIGFYGNEMVGDTRKIAEAQLALSSSRKHPEFSGNVKTVDTRSSWRGGYDPGFEGDHRRQDVALYGHNAETIMEVGNSLAWAMANLLQKR